MSQERRLSDQYFADIYEATSDPWRLGERWYEERKYAITVAMLPSQRYLHAFEAGCSVGVLTEKLTERCDHVTSIDVADLALRATGDRLQSCGRLDRATLRRASLDDAWPAGPFDLVVLSEVAYYLHAETLREVLDRECSRLADGATVIAAHWRHRVDDYPLSGDEANELILATPGLVGLGRYVDADVVIDVLTKGSAQSVATQTGVPGAPG